MTGFKAIDAFCGAGGLSIGLHAAGFSIVGGFDIDPFCIQTLKRNPKYIDHKVLEANIKDLLSGNLIKALGIQRGEIDLLAGGPPCQGFSIQRTVGDDHDDRNLLVDDYAGLILEVHPKFFLLENVPGIGGKRGKNTMEQFKSLMSQNNYVLHEKILDAQDFGVPQRRKRFILIGEFLNEGKSNFKWPASLLQKKKTVREAIEHLPPPPIGKDHPDYPFHRSDRLSELNLQRIRAIKGGQTRVDLPEELLAECHKRDANKIGHRNVYGRMSWDDVAPTITARFDSFTRGKFGHPKQDRSVSLLEGALLQTFPDDYEFVGNKVEIARQIGNAVPPQFAKSIGESIFEALKKHGSKS